MLWRKKRPDTHLKTTPQFAMFPGTPKEQERRYFQHHTVRTITGGNIMAPFTYKPRSILDVGCGAGHWALEIAAALPEAHVLGIDPDIQPMVSAAQPPPNCIFVRQSILDPLPYASQGFDYIHLRFMSETLPLAKWPALFTRLTDLLHPGGWLEWIESGAIVAAGPALTRLGEAWEQLGQRHGYAVYPGSQMLPVLRSTALGNVAYYPIDVPIGVNGDRIGKMTAQYQLGLFTALHDTILAAGIMTADEYQWCMDQANFEVLDSRSPYHAIWSLAIACAQRAVTPPSLPIPTAKLPTI